MAGFQGTQMSSDLQSAGCCINLTQDGAFTEEQRLHCVDDDVIEETDPLVFAVRSLFLRTKLIQKLNPIRELKESCVQILVFWGPILIN